MFGWPAGGCTHIYASYTDILMAVSSSMLLDSRMPRGDYQTLGVEPSSVDWQSLSDIWLALIHDLSTPAASNRIGTLCLVRAIKMEVMATFRSQNPIPLVSRNM